MGNNRHNKNVIDIECWWNKSSLDWPLASFLFLQHPQTHFIRLSAGCVGRGTISRWPDGQESERETLVYTRFRADSLSHK